MVFSFNFVRCFFKLITLHYLCTVEIFLTNAVFY